MAYACSDSDDKSTPNDDAGTNPAACTQDADCGDGNLCNGTETCGQNKRCQAGTPLNCDDNNVCNGIEACNPDTGCTSAESLVCDDGLPCTGEESCDPIAGCTRGTPPAGCCESDLDCNDDNVCNGVEACELETNTCVLQAPLSCDDNDPCNGLETCDNTTGCVAGTPLVCDDKNACNGLETCEAGKGCASGTPLACNDGLPCNGEETCDKAAGCVQGIPPAGCCTEDTDCNDKNACNGVETCGTTDNTCILGTALNCDDGNACTGVETCDPSLGCVDAPDLACDDSNPCNGLETCDVKAGCQPGTALDCNDNQFCTTDTCDANGCQHQPVTTLPLPTITGVAQGAAVSGSVLIAISIEDSPFKSMSVTVDGQPYPLVIPAAKYGGDNIGPIEIPFASDGTHSVSVTTTACNDEETTVERIFTIDNDAPTLVAVLSPEPNAAGWNNSPVTVTWKAEDLGSGIVAVTEPQVVSKPGTGVEITGTATDAAGLKTETTVILNLDFKAPVVTLDSPKPNQPEDDQLVLGSTEVTIEGIIADDALSGFATAMLTSSKTKDKITFTKPGDYSETLTLAVGINTIIVSATDVAGNTHTASICAIVDTSDPHVTVQYPPSGHKTTQETLDITGVANDLVVGSITDEDVTVAVNGVSANINNSQFIAKSVPLALGENTITATATDSVGHQATHSVTVTRLGADTKRLVITGGNNQTADVLQQVSDPLVVQLLDSDNAVIPDHNVVFGITNNDGTLLHPSPVMMSPKKRSLVAKTDADGKAQVQLVLGSRAGQAINRVTVSAEGAVSSVSFFASGEASEALNIHAHAGHNQIGAVGEPLPLPLSVVVTDSGDNPVSGQPVTFEVIKGNSKLGGGQSVTILSNANGFADAVFTLGTDVGYSTHAVRATIPVDPDGPSGTKDGVVFNASAFNAGDPKQTHIRGLVVDEDEQPVAGVRIHFPDLGDLGIDAFTGEDGRFTYFGAPVGFSLMEVDGTAAAPFASDFSFPSLTYEVHTVAGIMNDLERPIFMLRLNKGTFVNGLKDVTIGIEELPGFELHIPSGTKVTFPDGSHEGNISITQVHFDQAPMAPIDGLQSRILVTIQPPGVHFDPPAPLTVPNADNYPPNKKVEMFSFDHDLESFVSIGTGTVSDDGTLIKTDPGVGVVKGGWHCGADPQSSGECEKCESPSAGVKVSGMVGNKVVLTANGTPGAGTLWAWSKVCGDISVSGNSCPNKTSCSATVKGNGSVIRGRVKVTHICKEGGPQMSRTVDVNVCDTLTKSVAIEKDVGKESSFNTLDKAVKILSPYTSKLGCKLENKFKYTAGGNVTEMCCPNCSNGTGYRGTASFNGSNKFTMECFKSVLPIPVLELMKIKAGVKGSLGVEGTVNGQVSGTTCCETPPCVCAEGSADLSITGALELVLEIIDDSVAKISAGVNVGVGVGVSIDCKEACLNGCFKGLNATGKVAFLGGFISAEFTHPVACPAPLGGGCKAHQFNSMLKFGESTGQCTGNGDVCGGSSPPAGGGGSQPSSGSGTPACGDIPTKCQKGKCEPNCGNSVCGDDLCGGSCGECTGDTECSEGQCVCVPQCDGKACGDDGCGGVCGTCAKNEKCNDQSACECVPQCDTNACGPDTCGGSCGICFPNEVCVGGQCVCVPDCVGKKCGGDGCGTSCGTCGPDQQCSGSGQCEAKP